MINTLLTLLPCEYKLNEGVDEDLGEGAGVSCYQHFITTITGHFGPQIISGEDMAVLAEAYIIMSDENITVLAQPLHLVAGGLVGGCCLFGEDCEEGYFMLN